jgi:Mn-dependent DtxR family transcriptional regulator
MLNVGGSNDSSSWREFDRNQVSHSAAHYLMTIDRLHREFGYARVTDVAEKLDVSRGAVSMALTQLRKRAWVEEDPHRFVLLTSAGKCWACLPLRRRRMPVRWSTCSASRRDGDWCV